MKRFKRQTLSLLAAALLGAAFASPALAQTYPAKPIRIVVPFSAGGTVDQLARVMAVKMAPLLGQQLIVDNKPGAATMIG
ncbi:MAG: hypothetical protein I8H71_13130 [Xanthomonadaceae bacterium]|nr:hypothetical protein [Xanthomonadaceae bacterium]